MLLFIHYYYYHGLFRCQYSSSPTKTPPNWSNKVYAYLDNADKVLNGFETDWPQRAMQRALLIKVFSQLTDLFRARNNHINSNKFTYITSNKKKDAIKHNAFQNVPVNQQVMPELLFPEYFRVLVVLSSWTSFNRAPAAKRASEAVRDSFAILVARKNLSDVQNVEYNKIIGYGLSKDVFLFFFFFCIYIFIYISQAFLFSFLLDEN